MPFSATNTEIEIQPRTRQTQCVSPAKHRQCMSPAKHRQCMSLSTESNNTCLRLCAASKCTHGTMHHSAASRYWHVRVGTCECMRGFTVYTGT